MRLSPCALRLPLLIIALIGASAAAPADVFHEANLSVVWNSTVSAGSGIRVEGRDPMLVKRVNGILLGVAGASGGGADDAELNFPRAGDTFSTVAKAFTDLRVSYGDFGAVVRAKGWYDYQLEERGVPHGNINNGYVAGAPLSDAGFEREAKFSGAALAAAFAYGRHTDGDSSIEYRIGEQAVLSGIGIGRFIRGLSVNMPIDVPAVRRVGYIEPSSLPLRGIFSHYTHTIPPERPTQPGQAVTADADEVRLWLPPGVDSGYWDPETPIPVGAITGAYSFGARRPTVSAFYQYTWRPTVTAPCGTYFSPNDVNTDTSASRSCNAVELGQVVGTSILTEQQAVAQGRFIRMIDERRPKSAGQYGINLWLPFELGFLPIDNDSLKAHGGQIGLHYLNVHATTPVLDGIRGAPGQLYDLQPQPVRGRWIYPEDIRTLGVSVRTDPLNNWLVAAEFSYAPRTPVQINANDLLYASVFNGAGPAGTRVASVPIGAEVQGYDRVRKMELIVNGGIGIDGARLPRWMGIESGFIFIEAASQWVDLPDNGLRYGRAFMYGIAPAPGVLSTQTACATIPGNVGCDNDGYATRSAWGYRTRVQLTFPTGLPALRLKPAVTFAHDVKGFSIDNQLSQGRRTLDTTLRLEWLGVSPARYFAEIKYVTYANRAKFDALRDRDFATLNVGATF